MKTRTYYTAGKASPRAKIGGGIKRSKKLARKLMSITIALALVVSGFSFFSSRAQASGSVAETLPFLRMSADNTTITGFNYQAGVSPTDIVIPVQFVAGTDITAIGDNAFTGCGLTSVTFETGSVITTIGSSAFKGNVFTSITLPDTVTSLGNQVFYGCTLLQSIDLSNLILTTIPQSAFYQCTALTSAILPNTVTALGTYVFYGCSSLQSIDLSSLILTTIPTYSFFQCSSLTSVLLPEGLKTIDPQAFYGNTSLTYIKIPASVTNINGESTFYNLPLGSVIDLTNFTPGTLAGVPWLAENSIIRWNGGEDNTSNFIFNKDTGKICGLKESYATGLADGSLNLVIPKTIDGITVTGLCDGAFGSRPSNIKLKSVSFEAGSTITALPVEAFTHTSYLTSITLPEGITTIGYWCFHSSGIRTITLPTTITTIATRAFYGTSLTSITFTGNAVNSIASDAFVQLDTLKDIYLTQMAKDSVAGAPWQANYATIHWKDGDTLPLYVTDDTGLWIFSPASKTIVQYLGTTGATVDLTVPSQLKYNGVTYSITNINNLNTNIISGTKQLKSLTISDGITTISNYAFVNVKIGSLDLGNTVSTIIGAFNNCGLTSLTLPDSLKTILSASNGTPAFGNNAITGEIVIPGNVTSIDSYSFTNNPGITQITIKQYRLKASDGVYDDAAKKYLLAPTGIALNVPFGAVNAASQVYYMDDPMPLYTYTVVPDTVNNKAVIHLTAIMSDQTLLTSIKAGTGMPAVSNVQMANNGINQSTADMVVSANGNYTFVTHMTIYDKDHEYTVPVDCFHKVTYNGGGNTGGTVPAVGTYVEGYNLATLPGKGTLVKTGYAFKGWSADGTNVITSYTMGTTDVTLTALWAQTYTVTYNANGANSGTVPTDSNAYLINASATVLGNTGTLAKTGYAFKGWAKTAGATTPDYVAGNTFSITADTTLYAVWEKLHTVTYNANGADSGTAPVDSNEYANNASVTVKGNTGSLVKAGYTFKGWAKTLGASVADYQPGDDLTITSDVTLYAVWELIPVATPTPTPTATPEPTATPTPTPTATPTPTPTETPVITPTPTPVITPEPTVNPTPTPTPKQITVVAPPKKGYTFHGWYEDDKLISKNKTFTYNEGEYNNLQPIYTPVKNLNSDAPKTGDFNALALGGSSLLALAGLVLARKKKEVK